MEARMGHTTVNDRHGRGENAEPEAVGPPVGIWESADHSRVTLRLLAAHRIWELKEKMLVERG